MTPRSKDQRMSLGSRPPGGTDLRAMLKFFPTTRSVAPAARSGASTRNRSSGCTDCIGASLWPRALQGTPRSARQMTARATAAYNTERPGLIPATPTCGLEDWSRISPPVRRNHSTSPRAGFRRPTRFRRSDTSDLQFDLGHGPRHPTVGPGREADSGAELERQLFGKGEPDLRKHDGGVLGWIALELGAHAHDGLGRVADAQSVGECDIPLA